MENKKEIIVMSTSLLKSSVQKSIRRSLPEQTVKTAKTWIEADPVDAARRLFVISLEDCILHPDIADLQRVMQKKKGDISQDDKEKVLNIAYQLASCEWRDDFWKINEDGKGIGLYKAHSLKGELGGSEKELADAIFYRSQVGGMREDLQMLIAMYRLWITRFSEDWTADSLKEYFPFQQIKWDDVEYGGKDDLVLQGVDFHCSPLLKIIQKKEYCRALVRSAYPDEDVDNVLFNLIWRKWSAVNNKKQIGIGRPIDWFIDDGKPQQFEGELHREKFAFIWERIRDEVESIAKWFIKKTYENSHKMDIKKNEQPTLEI